MDTGKQKIFRDPIHGYIDVPRDICARFVDTAIFQRLRNIEQTSLRPVYPSAHHDRFVHSLGVYYLAKVVFGHLKANTAPSVLKTVDLSDFKPAFLVAALMHDCGHAPFSHTFEEFYNRGKRAETFLLDQVGGEFRDDYRHNYETGSGPAHHELFSAAIFLKHYGAAYSGLFPGTEPELVARMITGCIHQPAKNEREEVENCLIRLINGRAIDVDKLDYILRDTWASGVNNTSIDTHRLLSAVEIVQYEGMLVPAFNKSALSVIQGVVDARNYLFNWLYSHHTAWYYNDLLTTAVEKLSALLSPKEPDRLLDLIFSKEAFESPVQVDGFAVYLPCDGDIYCLLKQHYRDIPEVEEMLSRQPRRVPLWKTKVEFERIFESRPDSIQKASIRVKAKEYLKAVIPEEKYLKEVRVLEVKPKLAVIHASELYVSLNKEIVPFADLRLVSPAPPAAGYFYIFIPQECSTKAQACIDHLASVKVYS